MMSLPMCAGLQPQLACELSCRVDIEFHWVLEAFGRSLKPRLIKTNRFPSVSLARYCQRASGCTGLLTLSKCRVHCGWRSSNLSSRLCSPLLMDTLSYLSPPAAYDSHQLTNLTSLTVQPELINLTWDLFHSCQTQQCGSSETNETWERVILNIHVMFNNKTASFKLNCFS